MAISIVSHPLQALLAEHRAELAFCATRGLEEDYCVKSTLYPNLVGIIESIADRNSIYVRWASGSVPVECVRWNEVSPL